MDNQNLAIKVKDLRNLKGLSQEQLAEESRLSLRTIQRIEKGESTPRGDTLLRLTQALGVTPDDILDWSKTKDEGFVNLFHLSALGVILNPILGIVIPLVLWLYKKEKICDVDGAGKKLISFQITWTLILYVLFSFLPIISGWPIELIPIHLFLRVNFFDLINSIPVFSDMSGYIFIIMYLYNIFLIFLNIRHNIKGKKNWYKPAIPFLK